MRISRASKSGRFTRVPLLIGIIVAVVATVLVASSEQIDAASTARVSDAVLASKLQSPSSGNSPCRRDACIDYSDNTFRLDATGRYLTFEMDGHRRRSELRQLQSWSTLGSNMATGDVRLFVPDEGLNQYTFMQVHNEGAHVGPVVRLVWRRTRGKKHDRVWAAVRVSPDNPEIVEWFDMGPRKAGFREFSIQIEDNQLRLRREGKVRVSLSIDDWEDRDLYFKAGVYLQGEGVAKTQFKRLSFESHDDEPTEDEPTETPADAA